jgi:hypothetical protein
MLGDVCALEISLPFEASPPGPASPVPYRLARQPATFAPQRPPAMDANQSQYAKRILLQRCALRIEMAGTSPAMTIPSERNPL